MQLRSGVHVHKFTDSSGILFYNIFSEESVIVAVEQCSFELAENSDGTETVVLSDVSSDVMEQLISKRFVKR